MHRLIQSKREVEWAKGWLLYRYNQGDRRFDPAVVSRLDTVPKMVAYLEHHLVNLHDRSRLQKAISAKKSRIKDAHRAFTTLNLQLDTRDQLKALALNYELQYDEVVMHLIELQRQFPKQFKDLVANTVDA